MFSSSIRSLGRRGAQIRSYATQASSSHPRFTRYGVAAVVGVSVSHIWDPGTMQNLTSQAYLAATALSPARADSKAAKRIEPQSKVVGSSVPDNVESNVPDVVHSETEAGKGPGGNKVTISDVLAKKQGEEVWVVIKGEVYK